MIKNPVITISGPTASGKTGTSISLAQQLNMMTQDIAVIVNFDSLLFYKEISIGTAKPTIEEQSGVEHRLIDIRSISNPMNASEYVETARTEINNILKENRIPILVGGSGFYLRSLIKGMYDSTPPTTEIKIKVDQLYATEGIHPFLNILQEVDQDSYSRLHPNDHYRIQRAVEFYWTTGRPISAEKRRMEENDPYDFSKNLANDWNCFHIYLDLEKELHWSIIADRAKLMIKNGLENEVRNLLLRGFTGEESPLQSIGYKEILDYINGKYSNIEECLERISISTRQLAKSQRTWYKKITPKSSYNPLFDKNKIIEDCFNFLMK